MRTDIPPSGEAQRKAILEAVIKEGDALESVGLEIKSDVDLGRRGPGLAKVAKCILGMANRMPQDAQRLFGGYGVLVLGAGKSAAAGVPAGTEQHDLANRLRPYLGDPGPRWDLSRLSTQDGNEVLFIIIEPAAMGDPIYPCRKDYQSGSPDKKSDLADGDVYVRDSTSTRKARAHQIDALVRRALGPGGPKLNLTFVVHGEALAVADPDSMMSDWIERERQSLREDLAGNERGQTLPRGSPMTSLAERPTVTRKISTKPSKQPCRSGGIDGQRAATRSSEQSPRPSPSHCRTRSCCTTQRSSSGSATLEAWPLRTAKAWPAMKSHQRSIRHPTMWCRA